jgi:gluconokinase
MGRAVTTTIVVAGVSGVGKSAIAKELASRLGWPWAEGDDFHSAENRARMGSGIPLTDEDRWPWLDAIAAWIGRNEAEGKNGIVTCSALRRRYRDRLRGGHPSVWFAFLVADQATIAPRLAKRRHEFMPPSLLASQFAILEPLAIDEPGATTSARPDTSTIVDAIVAQLPADSNADAG